MRYRVARLEDAPAITELIASCDYYAPMDAAEYDGAWVVAETPDGEIVGCVWAMHCGRHAYIDYLCVHPAHRGRTALRLMLTLGDVLRALGVQYVRGVAKSDNQAAIRVDLAAGGVADDGYTLLFRRL